MESAGSPPHASASEYLPMLSVPALIPTLGTNFLQNILDTQRGMNRQMRILLDGHTVAYWASVMRQFTAALAVSVQHFALD